jgi:hypothetical protein
MKSMQLSDDAADLKVQQQSEFLMNGLKPRLDKIPSTQLKSLCEGEYVAHELDVPQFDFAALLTKIRSANAEP